VTLHFAYGSNMNRTLMGRRCPGAVALGTATLAGWRFLITPDGFGSIAPHQGGLVHGVLWRLTLPDLAAINAYESLDSGLSVRRMLPVKHRNQQVLALVYIARRSGEGRPRPGYIAVVAQAAREWNLPPAYARTLQRWSPSGWRGARWKDTGDVG
jgi:hypothetical protein